MPVKIERILAATDFSRAGQRAAQVAGEWARRTRAQLRIVHVTPPKGWLSAWGFESSATDAIDSHATNALKQVAENVDPERTLELSTGVLSGPAARCIARAAQEYAADLVITGARGERDAEGGRVLGGTADKLLAATDVPLLLVRRAREEPVTSVVAALDLSPHSKAVLEWAHFAAAERPLHAYHAFELPFTARLEAYGLAESGIDVYREQARSQRSANLASLVASIARSGATSCIVERGDPGIELQRYIEAVRPSLVVLGKHAQDARSTAASSVGSVCRFIAGNVSADVLAV
jgi:nucleotide-binding universal stress UspA family protein